MLTFLGNIIEWLVTYGTPVFVGIWALLAIVAFFNFLAKQMPEQAFFAGIHLVCIYGFYHWYFEMMADGPITSMYMDQNAKMVTETTTSCPAIIAMGVMLLCIFLARGMKAIGIPYVITFMLYLGIAIFGV